MIGCQLMACKKSKVMVDQMKRLRWLPPPRPPRGDFQRRALRFFVLVCARFGWLRVLRIEIVTYDSIRDCHCDHKEKTKKLDNNVQLPVQCVR